MQTFRSAKEKLVTARVKMLFKQPFFGNIACRLQLVEAGDWCTTAAVDGRNFYYNEEFVNKLDLDETVFLVGHEVGHLYTNTSSVDLIVILKSGTWLVTTKLMQC